MTRITFSPGSSGPFLRAVLLACLLPAAVVAVDEPIRIGDWNSVPDPARFDPAYPEMAEWAKAGVRGGIPPRGVSAIVERLKPGDDLQAALNRAGAEAKQRGFVADKKAGRQQVPLDKRYVVVLLAEGTYAFGPEKCQDPGYSNQPTGFMLRIPGGVILRGASRNTLLLFDPPRAKGIPEGRFDGFGGVRMIRMDSFSGLEDLTVRNKQVMEQDYSKVEGLYDPHPGIDRKDLPVLCGMGIDMSGSDSFMQNCAVLDMATCPVNASGTWHTLRDNLVERSWNKGKAGNGYYHTSGGHHSLFYNETIRNIRHVCIQGEEPRNKFHVWIHNRIEVDFNFHNGIQGSVLVQDCHIEPRPGHQWATGDGFQGYRESYADRNLVFRVTPFQPKGVHVIEQPGRCTAVLKPELPEPKGGTFYAVTGRHIGLAQVETARLSLRMEGLFAARKWSEAYTAASAVAASAAKGSAEGDAAGALLAKLEAQAKTDLAAVLAKPDPKALQAFLGAWGAWPGAAPAREAAAGIADAELAKLLATPPTSARLADFIRAWPGMAAGERAQKEYDALAAAAAAAYKESGLRAISKADNLKRLLKDWVPAWSPSLAGMRTAYEEALTAALAEASAAKGSARKAALTRIAKDHAGTAAAGQAAALLAAP